MVSERALRSDGGEMSLWEKRVRWVMRWVKSFEMEKEDRQKRAEVRGVR